jgi:hypothetical protein
MNKTSDLLKITQSTEEIDCISKDAEKYNEIIARRISELNRIIHQTTDDYLTDKFPYVCGCCYSYIVYEKEKGITERIGVLNSKKISKDGNFVLLTFTEWTDRTNPDTFDVMCNLDGTLIEWIEAAERKLVLKPILSRE